MKVLFAGPSLFGAEWDREGLALRGPARQGDIHAAVLGGAAAIGLVDGVFGSVPSVWHKEILFALQCGVRVLGAGSQGALRAAECHSFGMEPVGGIAAEYVSGHRTADADVCLAHCPAELDYLPLSEPLVDVQATCAALSRVGTLAEAEIAAVLAAADRMFFADRTLDRMLSLSGLPAADMDAVAAEYRLHQVHRKRSDALELVSRLKALTDQRARPPEWTFVQSDPWRHFLATRATAAETPPRRPS